MANKAFHKFRMDNQHRMFLDDKPLKGVQAMQFTMDIRTPGIGIMNLVLVTLPPELEHDKVEVLATTPKPEEKESDMSLDDARAAMDEGETSPEKPV
jgi:hypothetical protein